ncbi:MAG: glycosyl hydrolase-related protein [Oscillospiraceae bacterium]|nr:glycosyl hydrolase-related protein [Oscillospiraceae bacterium]MCL2152320.1 glycosyl hydrolase-related protein [Oscillospiraceae bacterium]
MKRNFRMFKRFIAVMLAVMLAVMMVMQMAAVHVAAADVTIDKTWTLYMVPNTHLDTAWQSPYKQVVEGNGSNGLRPMLGNVIGHLNGNSSYIFTTSASKHYEWAKEYFGSDNPDNRRYWDDMKALVAKGQWDITGGQLVEPDLNLPSGESFARHSLYAQHFFEREFGRDKQPTTGMVPDVFGFAGQLPQVLYKSEMPYFVTSKVNWSERTGVSAYYEDPESGTNQWRNHRGNDDNPATNRGRQSDIWWWQGLDGKSSVLSNFLTYDYNWTTTDARGPMDAVFTQNWQDGYETGVKIGLFFFGSGDFGQGLTGTASGNSFVYVSQTASNANTKFSVANKGTSAFFKDLDDIIKADEANVAAGAEPTINIPTHTGEIYLEYHRGTYTSWARIKEYNRKNEILADSAEKAATLGFYTGVTPTNNSDTIEWAWNRVLTDQMHDVLPGSSVAYQYYQSYNFQEQSKNLFNSVRNNALAGLAYRADTNVQGSPVFVFNELSWARSGEVTVEVYDPLIVPAVETFPVIFDGATQIYPSNAVRNPGGKATLTFMAPDVPALGYKVFDVRFVMQPPPARSTALKVDVDNLTFENETLRMQINPKTGYISSLKYNGREMFAQGVGMEGGELHVYRDTEERPDQGFDQWELNMREMNKEPSWIVDGLPVSIDVIENTPDKVTVQVVKLWNGSAITQKFSMYPGVDHVDVNLNAEWFQTKRLLKVSFPINADNSYATYDAAYGAVQRPTDRITPFQQARYEVPGHKWVDVTDKSGDYGVSILNDAKYGHDSWRRTAGDTTFVRSRITVCRTPRAQSFASNSAYNPSSPYVIDSGVHNFNYSIAPHEGGIANGSVNGNNTMNKAYGLGTPMKAFEAAKTPSNGLGASESFASVAPTNVIMSALKNQYDNPSDPNTIVVRVYEAAGLDTDDVTITLPGNVISAKEVNILEHDYDSAHGYDNYETKKLTIAGKTVKFDIGKFEVITIEAKIAPFAQAALQAPAQKALSLAYNQRATSPRSARNTAFVEGAGTSASPGFSMPEKNWPAGVGGLDFMGIKFNVGPIDANNILSGGSGANIAVSDPQAGYGKVYIVGFSTARTSNTMSGTANTGACAATGTITVNYSTGDSTLKTIDFNSWRTDLSGWDRYAWTDTKPYVYDTIIHVNTFFQQSTATNTNADHLTNENFLFLYSVDVDKSRAISSIGLPDNSDIKIVAVTLADPLPGLGVVYDAPSVGPRENVTPAAPTNVSAKYDPGSNNLRSLITWTKSVGAYKYSVYGSTSPDFTVGTSTLLGSSVSGSYVHQLPFGVTEANAAAGNDKWYYRVVAIGRNATATADLTSAASDLSNAVTVSNIDYCLNITNGAANTARVIGGADQSTTLAAWKATNGVWGTSNDKWSCNSVASGNAWVSVRVGYDGLKEVKRFVLAHGGMNSGESHNGANRKFSIWYSNDSTNGNPNNGTWTQLFNETNNTAIITYHELISPLAVDWVQFRINPDRGGWRGVTGGSGATYGTAWVYEFAALSDNPNAGQAGAKNAEIEIAPFTSSSMRLAVSYESVGAAPDTVTYQWYKRFTDRYGDLYVPIPGEIGSAMAQTNVELGMTTGYKCEITTIKNGVAQVASAEIGSPLSTITGAKIIPVFADGGANLEVNYTYYSEFPLKENASKYQWYKKTAIEPDGRYLPIPGATDKTLSQTESEFAQAEAYRCEVSVYDTDGAKGRVVNVDYDVYFNQLLNATVVSETRTGAANMVDGSITSKWQVATTTYPSPHAAVFDMGSVKEIDRLRIFHAPSDPFVDVDGGMDRYNDKDNNAPTYDFDISYSEDADGPWVTETIRSNKKPITDIKLSSRVKARYVKIDVITPSSTRLSAASTFWDPNYLLRIREVQALVRAADVKHPVILDENGDVIVNVNDIPEGNVNVIVAAYNEKGVMLGYKSVLVAVDETGIINCVIPEFTISKDAATVKVFFWADPSYTPVAEAILAK